jgi:hypothetical protein
MSDDTEHKMSLSVGAARAEGLSAQMQPVSNTAGFPSLTPAAIAQFQSRSEFTGNFVQLISAKFRKNVFSRFYIALC